MQIWVKSLDYRIKTDFEQFLDWAYKNPKNEFDQGILKYPTTEILTAFKERGDNVVHLPYQVAVVLESIAKNPSAPKNEVGLALKVLLHEIVSKARNAGINEIYFLATEESVAEFAAKHGFEELKWKVFRMKLSDLEKKDEGLSQVSSRPINQ